jgi:hypothetical protein
MPKDAKEDENNKKSSRHLEMLKKKVRLGIEPRIS